MPMKNPPHLGGFVRREILDPFRLSVTAAAQALDVTRQALSNLVNEKAALTADMAMRSRRRSESAWNCCMRMQLAYDIAEARARERTIKVKRYKAARRKRHRTRRRACARSTRWSRPTASACMSRRRARARSSCSAMAFRNPGTRGAIS